MLRHRTALPLLIAAIVLAGTAPAQLLTKNCRTWCFQNNTPGFVDDLRLVFGPLPGGAGGPYILENVVLPPPSVTGGPVCPQYSWNCGGGPVMLINFAFPGVDTGQWVAVTVSSPAGIFPLVDAQWNFIPGPGTPAVVYEPPHLVLNEISTGLADWIEIYNLGPSISVGGIRVEVREDPGTTIALYTFPAATVIPTCGRVVLTDSATAPTLAACPGLGLPGSTIVTGAIPWNLADQGAVYLIAPPAAAGGSERPVDSLAFGYFQPVSNRHPDFPVSSPIQNYTDETNPTNDQVTLYRMDTCLRFDADSWHNQQVPATILLGGVSTAPISSATPGCPNPGECTTYWSCPGPTALTLRVAKCPLAVHVDGAVPGTTVFVLASTDLRGTQSSGTLGGLNPFSNLLFAIFLGGFPAPFSGVAAMPSICGTPTTASYEINFGFVPGLTECVEVAAYGVVQGAGAGAAIVPMLSNVVRVP